MALLYLDESPGLVARIRAAIDADDPRALIAPAHSLKNWAGNFVALGRLRLGRAKSRNWAAKATWPEGSALLAELEREIDRLDRAGGGARTAHSRRRRSRWPKSAGYRNAEFIVYPLNVILIGCHDHLLPCVRRELMNCSARLEAECPDVRRRSGHAEKKPVGEASADFVRG